MTAPGAGRGATEAEIVVAEVHLPGLEMAEWVIREMAGRHGHASAIDAAGLLMRLRGAIWPAHRAAGSVYPTPFDPLAARPSPRDGSIRTLTWGDLRRIADLAAQLGAGAREGEADPSHRSVEPEFGREPQELDSTTPRSEDGHGRG